MIIATFIQEIGKDTNILERNLCLCSRRISIVKLSTPPKTIYMSNASNFPVFFRKMGKKC